jgi:hypothetical protein
LLHFLQLFANHYEQDNAKHDACEQEHSFERHSLVKRECPHGDDQRETQASTAMRIGRVFERSIP